MAGVSAPTCDTPPTMRYWRWRPGGDVRYSHDSSDPDEDSNVAARGHRWQRLLSISIPIAFVQLIACIPLGDAVAQICTVSSSSVTLGSGSCSISPNTTLNGSPAVHATTNARLLASDLVSLVRTQGVSVICLADLPPSPPSKSRYLVKRLHAAMPDLRIIVGRWSPPTLADESSQALKDAGATLVATSLVETREYLCGLVEIVRIPAPQPGGPKSDLKPSIEPPRSLIASS